MGDQLRGVRIVGFSDAQEAGGEVVKYLWNHVSVGGGACVGGCGALEVRSAGVQGNVAVAGKVRAGVQISWNRDEMAREFSASPGLTFGYGNGFGASVTLDGKSIMPSSVSIFGGKGAGKAWQAGPSYSGGISWGGIWDLVGGLGR